MKSGVKKVLPTSAQMGNMGMKKGGEMKESKKYRLNNKIMQRF